MVLLYRTGVVPKRCIRDRDHRECHVWLEATPAVGAPMVVTWTDPAIEEPLVRYAIGGAQ